MSKLVYDDSFYKNRNRNSEYAAEKILGIVFEEFQQKPNSVIDIGCGVGTWLRVAKEKYGATCTIGVDGDYVPKRYLQIAKEEFHAEDIEKYTASYLYQYNQNSRYDLAISLEVAEHIDKKYAKKFVRNLCDLSDAICFSAAVPKQGGDAHINEQRLSYWEELFRENEYILGDVIRADIWNDRKIPVWYRNNVVLFYKKDTIELKTKYSKCIRDIVHPDMYEKKICLYERKIQQLEESRNLKCLMKEEIWKIMKKAKFLQL